MTATQVIVLAIPFFVLLMAAEAAWGHWRGRSTYRLGDTLGSLSLGLMSQLSAVGLRLLGVGAYAAAYQALALWPHQGFWLSAPGWLLALLLYDFCYYWLHRAGHEVALFWAAHVVHHQSTHYNLSTALRQTSTGGLLGWVFYLPMAVLGVPPLVFGVVALVDLLYQFWVHTEHVGRLGWFDRVFCSPSNHRVHHAVNDGYLDHNYGGILVVWDRLFGTFREETEPCVYGTRKPLRSLDPLWANLEVYAQLWRTCRRSTRWADRLGVWWRPPGWQPPGQPAPDLAFDLAQATHYSPALSTGTAWLAVANFVLLMGGVAACLWSAQQWPVATNAVAILALVTGLWAVAGLTQGRWNACWALTLQLAALSVASATLGWTGWHLFAKPATMVIAIIYVALNTRRYWTNGQFDWKNGRLGLCLALALAFSLLGDVLLMLPGHFIGGLLAFLSAHLAYIALLRIGQARWFAHRPALAVTLLVGGGVYAVLWPGLGPVLRVAVAAYVLVIACMAAQAMGRAHTLASPAARAVALGAALFMVSDTLLAFNRFISPLPLAPLWVLSSYYAAQLLIVRHLLAQPPATPAG